MTPVRQKFSRRFTSWCKQNTLVAACISAVWRLRYANGGIRYLLRGVSHGVALNRQGSGHRFLLRRAIHILEKVAADPTLRTPNTDSLVRFITSTILSAARGNPVDPKTHEWAAQVISIYARKQPPGHFASAAAFELRRRLFSPSNAYLRPYAAGQRPALQVSYDALLSLAYRRRSVRKFAGQRVPIADIKRALAIAIQSPSACNRQPFQFRFFDRPAIVAAIADAAPGVRGLTFPALILITVQYRAYHDDRELICPIVDAAQAVMAFQLALETLGLSSLCINWPSDRQADERLRQAVDLPADECAILRLGIGYADPAGMIAASPKRAIEEIFSANKDIINP